MRISRSVRSAWDTILRDHEVQGLRDKTGALVCAPKEYGQIRILNKSDFVDKQDLYLPDGVKPKMRPERPELIVGGYASPQVVDKEKHLITKEAMIADLPRFLAHPHYRNVMVVHTNIQVGEVLPEWTHPRTGEVYKTQVDDIGLFAVVRIRTDPFRPAIIDKVIEDIESGELAAFSISGDAPYESRQYQCSDGSCFWVINEIEHYEITLCQKGINQDAKYTILSKALFCEDGSCELKLPTDRVTFQTIQSAVAKAETGHENVAKHPGHEDQKTHAPKGGEKQVGQEETWPSLMTEPWTDDDEAWSSDQKKFVGRFEAAMGEDLDEVYELLWAHVHGNRIGDLAEAFEQGDPAAQKIQDWTQEIVSELAPEGLTLYRKTSGERERALIPMTTSRKIAEELSGSGEVVEMRVAADDIVVAWFSVPQIFMHEDMLDTGDEREVVVRGGKGLSKTTGIEEDVGEKKAISTPTPPKPPNISGVPGDAAISSGVGEGATGDMKGGNEGADVQERAGSSKRAAELELHPGHDDQSEHGKSKGKALPKDFEEIGSTIYVRNKKTGQLVTRRTLKPGGARLGTRRTHDGRMVQNTGSAGQGPGSADELFTAEEETDEHQRAVNFLWQHGLAYVAGSHPSRRAALSLREGEVTVRLSDGRSVSTGRYSADQVNEATQRALKFVQTGGREHGPMQLHNTPDSPHREHDPRQRKTPPDEGSWIHMTSKEGAERIRTEGVNADVSGTGGFYMARGKTTEGTVPVEVRLKKGARVLEQGSEDWDNVRRLASKFGQGTQEINRAAREEGFAAIHLPGQKPAEDWLVVLDAGAVDLEETSVDLHDTPDSPHKEHMTQGHDEYLVERVKDEGLEEALSDWTIDEVQGELGGLSNVDESELPRMAARFAQGAGADEREVLGMLQDFYREDVATQDREQPDKLEEQSPLSAPGFGGSHTQDIGAQSGPGPKTRSRSGTVSDSRFDELHLPTGAEEKATDVLPGIVPSPHSRDPGTITQQEGSEAPETAPRVPEEGVRGNAPEEPTCAHGCYATVEDVQEIQEGEAEAQNVEKSDRPYEPVGDEKEISPEMMRATLPGGGEHGHSREDEEYYLNKATDTATVVLCVALNQDGHPVAGIRQDRKHGETYEFPGGHVRAGETLRQGAERELAEESGVTARAVRKLSEKRSPNDGVPVIFVHLEVIGGEPADSNELTNVAYHDPDKVKWAFDDSKEAVNIALGGALDKHDVEVGHLHPPDFESVEKGPQSFGEGFPSSADVDESEEKALTMTPEPLVHTEDVNMRKHTTDTPHPHGRRFGSGEGSGESGPVEKPLGAGKFPWQRKFGKNCALCETEEVLEQALDVREWTGTAPSDLRLMSRHVLDGLRRGDVDYLEGRWFTLARGENGILRKGLAVELNALISMVGKHALDIGATDLWADAFKVRGRVDKFGLIGGSAAYTRLEGILVKLYELREESGTDDTLVRGEYGEVVNSLLVLMTNCQMQRDALHKGHGVGWYGNAQQTLARAAASLRRQIGDAPKETATALTAVLEDIDQLEAQLGISREMEKGTIHEEATASEVEIAREVAKDTEVNVADADEKLEAIGAREPDPIQSGEPANALNDPAQQMTPDNVNVRVGTPQYVTKFVDLRDGDGSVLATLEDGELHVDEDEILRILEGKGVGGLYTVED